jgi:HD-like signal output (HDOD) protein
MLADLVARGDLVIPPYPAAALRLRRIVETDNFGLSEVADAASADPALAAALLRVANSALYQSSGGAVVTTLGRAVHRLGARSVAAIATAAAVSATANAPGPLIDVKYRVWRHSVTCALACQRFADRATVDPDEAFLAGLLHGFGRSVAVACLERVLPSLPQKQMSLLEWMQAAEPHRGELARAVAKQWQLPEPLVQAVAGENASTSQPMSALVAFADRLAAAIDRGLSSDEIAEECRVQPNASRSIESFLESLPSAIEALAQAPPASKRPKGPGAVTRPATALHGDLRAGAIEVSDLRVLRDPIPVPLLAISAEGLAIHSQKPMQESCIVRLGLRAGTEKLDGWFAVLLCVPEHNHFRVELQPFAATREMRKFLTEQSAKSPPLPPKHTA